jgi:hypothetical protein
MKPVVNLPLRSTTSLRHAVIASIRHVRVTLYGRVIVAEEAGSATTAHAQAYITEMEKGGEEYEE